MFWKKNVSRLGAISLSVKNMLQSALVPASATRSKKKEVSGYKKSPKKKFKQCSLLAKEKGLIRHN